MARRSIIISIAATAALAAAGIGGAYYVAKQRSLIAGITQTNQALQQVNQLINENNAEAADLFSDVARDKLIPKEVKDVIDEGISTFKATREIENHDYTAALQKGNEAIAGIWGLWNPYVAGGKALVDAAVKVLKARSILRQDAHLMILKGELEEQLYRLKGKELGNQVDWTDLSVKMRGDPPADRARFNSWLQNHGIEKKD